MTDIVWENPPADVPTSRASKHDDLAAALRRRPGRWAVFSDSASNSAVSAINKGKLTAFRPAGDYEAASRIADTGRAKVWVRYIGRPTNRSAHLAEIRAWATAQGWDVNTRGRIPQQILDTYDTAHQEQP